MAGRIREQVMQVTGHRVHAAWPSPGCHVAVWPDQDDRPGAVVTRPGHLRDVAGGDVEVCSVGPQPGVAQHAG